MSPNKQELSKWINEKYKQQNNTKLTERNKNDRRTESSGLSAAAR